MISVLVLIFSVFIPFITSQATLNTQCSTDVQYYDASELKCLACDTNLVSLPTLPYQCSYPIGNITQYSTDSSTGKLIISCGSCDISHPAVSKDGTKCLACASPSTFDQSLNDCTCPGGMYLVESDDTSSKSCLSCPEKSITSSPNRYECEPCPDQLMVVIDGACNCNGSYTLSESSCVYTPDLQSLQLVYSTSSMTISFQDFVAGDSPDTVQSQIFSTYFYSSAAACKEFNMTGCQSLSNLCVLQEYSQTASACLLYLQYRSLKGSSSVNGIADWTAAMPWLYYTSDPRTVISDTTIKMKVAFQSDGSNGVQYLQFYLAGYYVNGSFAGFEKLGSQFDLCQGSSSFLSFGNNYASSCKLDLASVFAGGYTSTVFYDMYILDETDDTLKPIPVRLLNYRSGALQVNINSNTDSDIIDDVFTRRFFIFDTIGGIEQSSDTTVDQTPLIVRYPKSITLTISTQPSLPQLIYMPILDIQYADVHVTDLATADTVTSFQVVYQQDMTNFWRTALILIILALVAGFILWLYRMFLWMRRNQHPGVTCMFTLRNILLISDACSDMLFWLLFGICCYWFLFYKGQANVFLLIPADSDTQLFVAILIAVFIGKCFRIIDVVWRQSTTDVFFIDWEKTRGRLLSRPGDSQSSNAPVSVWRSLLIANEWNELQTLRWTSITFSLIFIVFLMRGLNLEYLATSQPDSKDLTEGPTNRVLRFAITTFFWLALSLAQYLFKVTLKARFAGDPVLEFQDLLSMANLSMIVFTERNCGYYVHGRTVHAHADAPMLELHQNLKKEADNLSTTRGLLPNSIQQSFELHITPKLREQFDNIHLFLLAHDGNPNVPLGMRQQPQSMMALSGNYQLLQRSNVPPEKLVKGYFAISKLFTSFIDHNNPEHAYQVREKTGFQRLLRYPPDVALQNQSVMYPCSPSKIGNALFGGAEYDLLLFDILIYSLVDLHGNTLLSALITYIADYLLTSIRGWAGKTNISRKCLIDPRFLI